jgi:3-deoxy-D-manno-octulosonic-acid transferase
MPGAGGRLTRAQGAFVIGVYHVVYLLVFLFYAPVLLWRMLTDPRYRRGLRQRMGSVPRTRGGGRVVWIHGVSVGEIKAAGTLIRRLREQRPDLQLVLSATTPAGHELAERQHGDLRVIFYPLDFGPFPARALQRIAPACVLLMELEIWPNFLQSAARRHVPVAVINGRISERSFRGYRRVRGMLPQFDLIRLYCVQDEAYRQRLLQLGVDPQRIVLTGNMKYDSVLLKDPPADAAALRSWLAPDDRFVLVGGSTHGGEDQILAQVVQRLQQQLQAPLRLVLAPRHPERAAAVVDQLGRIGARCVLWSEVQSRRQALPEESVLLVDTIGHLEAFYGACDAAFVGGSLVRHGGQNMLEPAALGKPVVFGPHTWNFRNDVQLLLAAQAAALARNAAELEQVLAAWHRDPDLRAEVGHRAVAVIRANQGATDRTLKTLPTVLGEL